MFIAKVAMKATENDIRNFFKENNIATNDVQLIEDKRTRKSKGFGYVELKEISSVPAALALSGKLLCNLPITIQISQAEKNLIPSVSQLKAKGELPGNRPLSAQRRLYVGSLFPAVTEEDLRVMFAPYGEIDFIDLPRDPATGKHRGYGFVQFSFKEGALDALEKANGVVLHGRSMKVAWGVEPGQPEGMATVRPMNPYANLAAIAPSLANSIPGLAGVSTIMGFAQANAAQAAQAAGGAPGLPGGLNPLVASLQNEMLEDSGGGVALTPATRAALMAKLSRDPSAAAASVAAAAGPSPLIPGSIPLGGIPHPLVPGVIIPGLPPGLVPPGLAPPLDAASLFSAGGSVVPTRCIILENMFDPATETDPNFDELIKEDVQEECARCGKVLYIGVDKESSKGIVFVKMETVAAAQSVVSALHGRWFAGKQVMAVSVIESHFDVIKK